MNKVTDLEGRLEEALKKADKEEWSCLICELRSSFRWTDTHGIAQCSSCGAPYRIYHYENDKRVSKPPECLIADDWIDRCRRFYLETKRPMPGGFSFDPSYEVSSAEDRKAWEEWNQRNGHESNNR